MTLMARPSPRPRPDQLPAVPCPPCAEAARFEQATRSARLDALIATDELPAVTR